MDSYPDTQILNPQILHSGDPIGCCISDPDSSEQVLRDFFSHVEVAMRGENASFVMDELVLRNKEYIAMARCGGGNWHDPWTNVEDSNTLEGSSTNSQSRQGRERFIFDAFWTVYDAVALGFVRICQFLRVHGSRNNSVLDVEKCLQNHEVCPSGSTKSSEMQAARR